MFERKIMIKNHWIENKTKSNLYENRCFGIKECAEKWKNSKYVDNCDEHFYEKAVMLENMRLMAEVCAYENPEEFFELAKNSLCATWAGTCKVFLATRVTW